MSGFSSFSRRQLFRLGTASAAAIGCSGLMVNAQAAPPVRPAHRSRLSRPDRIFLERGLIHAAWIRAGSNDGWFPSGKLWRDSGFTTPQYYGEMIAASAQKKLEYGTEAMRGKGDATWALSRAPYPKALFESELPDPEADWMTPRMRRNSKDLVSICFGDEEVHSQELIDWYETAFAATRRKLPDVLLHNNQALDQYPAAVLGNYVKQAKPDLLTYDWYIWQQNPSYPGGSPTKFYTQLGRYRNTALAGHDGTGGRPIAFGQYTIGFRLQPPRQTPEDRFKRRIYVSASQQSLTPYMTWAAGGKWLSMFRWELDEEYLPWETDGLFMTDTEGRRLPAYDRYRTVNADMTAFSPWLTRLRTQTFSRLGGLTETGAPTQAPANVAAFHPGIDAGSGVVGLSAVNVGNANGGRQGDVLLGTFRELPEMNSAENKGVLPDRDHTCAFMLVNGLTAYNVDATDPYSTGGSWAQTRQRITVDVAVPRNSELYRITRNASARRVDLTRTDVGHQFTVDLDGGTGALYVWG